MKQLSKTLHVAIVAGEASGDLLGADLIKALKSQYPHIEFEGIAGPKMMEAGCKALFSIDRLSVMGLVEPIKHLPDILKIRRNIKRYFLKSNIDVFIGIDAPDFNLGLESELKKAGIPVVHYVSPSVWAWREKRIHKIKRAVNLMLTLFPFEADFYHKHQVPVQFVGHPLADQLPLKPDQEKSRLRLGLDLQKKTIAILPGSRAMEIKRLAADFIQTAQWCLGKNSDVQFVSSMINHARLKQFQQILCRAAPSLPIRVIEGKSIDVITAADVILAASGTVTLEAMLLKRPMIVAYRLSPLTYFIVKHMVKVDCFSLPNLIAQEKLIPELVQKEVTAEKMGPMLLELLDTSPALDQLKEKFTEMHHALKKGASQKAAKAILDLVI